MSLPRHRNRNRSTVTACTGRHPVLLVVVADPATRELIGGALDPGDRVGDRHGDHVGRPVSRHVIGVGSAEAAEVSLRCHRPDLVVCDLVLPGRTGADLVRRIRAESRFDSIAVIVLLPARDDDRDDDLRVGLLESGANDVIEKPFTPAELAARVNNLLAPAARSAELRARIDELSERTEQLQEALHSRVVIEQAKAFIAAEQGIGLSEAFDVLRSRARSQRAPIRSVACDVVRRHEESTALDLR